MTDAIEEKVDAGEDYRKVIQPTWDESGRKITCYNLIWTIRESHGF